MKAPTLMDKCSLLLDEVVKDDPKGSHREFMMNLTTTDSCTLSNPDFDLAVISLNGFNAKFGNDLLKSGYVPIESELIAEDPSKEGAELFTVGYPGSTAVLGQLNLTRAEVNWSSNSFSLPVITFGRASMIHQLLPFYWVDMSIYPGNSGGPVIEDGKLVGIVSQQALIPIDNCPACHHTDSIW